MPQRYIAGVCLLVLAGCAASPNPPAPSRLPQSSSMATADRNADPQLREATEKAQKTLDDFIKRLSAPKRGETFSIEIRDSAEDNTPIYFWLSDVTYKGGVFTGTVTTRPKKASRVRYGDQSSAKRADVTDWLILKSGRSEGGFTIEILMTREGAPG